MKTTYTVPTREQMSAANKAIYDLIQQTYGFIPNLFAVLTYSDTALPALLALQQSHTKGAFTAREREAINLVVSQTNECQYCTAAHSAIGKLNGFSDEQLLAIRRGEAPFDPKLDAVVRLAKAITLTKGHPDPTLLEAFFAAGYSQGALVDMTMLIGDRVILNYIHALTQVPVDFPSVPALTEGALH